MKIAKGAIVLFTGDSITDCGRARPVGKGAGLGSGYVAIAQERLKDNVVLNTGISGHTVRDLAARWDNDVINLKPDWLTLERREATIATISQQMNAFTIMMNAFMIGIHQLSIMANLTPDKHLSNGVWVLLVGFLGGTGYWVYKMMAEFKLPQAPTE